MKHNARIKRWMVEHDILLWKDKDFNRIHRWRNITLVEGDLQYVMKTIWAQRLLKMQNQSRLNLRMQ